jgi:hypothetical protein
MGDEGRRARVYRATVQLEDPKALATFLQAEKIDVIVFEGEPAPYETPPYAEFRKEIESFVGTSKAFTRVGEYDFLYGRPGKEKAMPLLAYARTVESTATAK